MNSASPAGDATVLLTGATGYVGGRLLSRLKDKGLRIRCLVRRLEEFEGQGTERVEFVQGDLLDPGSLRAALEGVEVAYYMVHAMGSGPDFEALDQQAATNFAQAAKVAGVKRIIYLGGLGDESESLSPHLRSRHEVGRLLKDSGSTVLELRASIILGTGSLSFELIRALVERLPIMITPRWVRVEAQPILITDVLAYLVAALDLPQTQSQVFEIGGADRCTYGDLMNAYAKQRGLRRWMIGVPFLTPHLSSLWLGLITPLYARGGRKLIGSIRNPTVVQSDAARTAVPEIEPLGLDAAMAQVLEAEDASVAQTRWCDAVSAGGQHVRQAAPKSGTRFLDQRSLVVAASAHAAFAPIRKIGGTRGWYCGTWLWRVRGFIDLLVGGVGLRRGRRDPDHLRVGEPLDFWRVEALEPDRRLVLRAEMKLPGKAWLEYQVEPEGEGSRIHQTAIFDARGVLGRLYWWAVFPLHAWIFSGMLAGIARRALEEHASAEAARTGS
ncbi:MAG: SDR family oxidoreductase [Planctomycetota bacterium]|nr:SDR family oxidoreductase [Planctomycetota bacterium]